MIWFLFRPATYFPSDRESDRARREARRGKRESDRESNRNRCIETKQREGLQVNVGRAFAPEDLQRSDARANGTKEALSTGRSRPESMIKNEKSRTTDKKKAPSMAIGFNYSIPLQRSTAFEPPKLVSLCVQYFDLIFAR